MKKPIWWDYATFYPEEDEAGFDGEHCGGLKGLRADAPENIKVAYEEYLRHEQKDKPTDIDC